MLARRTRPASRDRFGRKALGSVLAFVLLLLIAACGGNSDSDSAQSEDSESAGTESTTTAPEREDADPATKELAIAAVLQTADFGAGWKEYAAGGPWTPDEESCAYQPGGPEEALQEEATVNGPTVQLEGTSGFVSSRSYVFPTEADATAWVEIADGDEWAECHRQKLQAGQEESGSGTEIRLETRENAALGQEGFESYAKFVGVDANGAVVYVDDKAVYRIGRVVIVVDRESTALGDQAQAFDDGSYAALTAAYARVSGQGG